MIHSGFLAVQLAALHLAFLPPLVPVQPAAPVASRTVVIECPNISCWGRFQDSLRANIVKKHDWISSVKVESVKPGATAPAPLPQNMDPITGQISWGISARLTFAIDSQRQPRELARLLAHSGYYQTTGWILVERVPFSDLDE